MGESLTGLGVELETCVNGLDVNNNSDNNAQRKISASPLTSTTTPPVRISNTTMITTRRVNTG